MGLRKSVSMIWKEGTDPTGAVKTARGLQLYDRLFIGGEWVEPATGRTFESLNPATGKPWALVAEGVEEDIDRAVRATRKAFASGPWPRLAPHQGESSFESWGTLSFERPIALPT